MHTEVATQRVAELLRVLHRMTALHQELEGLIREKIQRMRDGQTELVQACTQREELLLKTLTDQEGLRRQLMDAIGRGFGINPQSARRMPLRQLAERLEGHLRTKLLAALDGLRRAAGDVARVNQVAMVIAQQILHHLRCIFASVSGPQENPALYSPQGRVVAGGGRGLFELMG